MTLDIIYDEVKHLRKLDKLAMILILKKALVNVMAVKKLACALIEEQK